MSEFSASTVARLVSAFDSSGIHRMCSPGDYASGEWLCSEAAGRGVEISRMPVRTTQTINEDAYIECDGQRIDGLPMFDSPSTGNAVLKGTLCAYGERGEIAYLEQPPSSASIKGMSFENMRRQAKHAAMVVTTRVTGDSLAPINAQFYDAPFGSPVLLVAGMHHAFLLHHAGAHTAITLTSNHRRVAADSYNISARVASDSAASPLVVLTPRTGWWESTAERAGGIVAWLAALSAGAALHRESRLRRDVVGFATCGHELGHLGLNALLQQQQHLLSSAACWLHLGANLGCASNATLFLRSTETADSEHMRDLLVAESYPVGAICIEPVSKASGEGRDIVDHGGKILSMAGSNAHFHAASDRWPGNVSSSRTAAIARAVGNWLCDSGMA